MDRGLHIAASVTLAEQLRQDLPANDPANASGNAARALLPGSLTDAPAAGGGIGLGPEPYRNLKADADR